MLKGKCNTATTTGRGKQAGRQTAQTNLTIENILEKLLGIPFVRTLSRSHYMQMPLGEGRLRDCSFGGGGEGRGGLVF